MFCRQHTDEHHSSTKTKTRVKSIISYNHCFQLKSNAQVGQNIIGKLQGACSEKSNRQRSGQLHLRAVHRKGIDQVSAIISKLSPTRKVRASLLGINHTNQRVMQYLGQDI